MGADTWGKARESDAAGTGEGGGRLRLDPQIKKIPESGTILENERSFFFKYGKHEMFPHEHHI